MNSIVINVVTLLILLKYVLTREHFPEGLTLDELHQDVELLLVLEATLQFYYSLAVVF